MHRHRQESRHVMETRSRSRSREPRSSAAPIDSSSRKRAASRSPAPRGRATSRSPAPATKRTPMTRSGSRPRVVNRRPSEEDDDVKVVFDANAERTEKPFARFFMPPIGAKARAKIAPSDSDDDSDEDTVKRVGGHLGSGGSRLFGSKWHEAMEEPKAPNASTDAWPTSSRERSTPESFSSYPADDSTAITPPAQDATPPEASGSSGSTASRAPHREQPTAATPIVQLKFQPPPTMPMDDPLNLVHSESPASTPTTHQQPPPPRPVQQQPMPTPMPTLMPMQPGPSHASYAPPVAAFAELSEAVTEMVTTPGPIAFILKRMIREVVAEELRTGHPASPMNAAIRAIVRDELLVMAAEASQQPSPAPPPPPPTMHADIRGIRASLLDDFVPQHNLSGDDVADIFNRMGGGAPGPSGSGSGSGSGDGVQ